MEYIISGIIGAIIGGTIGAAAMAMCAISGRISQTEEAQYVEVKK